MQLEVGKWYTTESLGKLYKAYIGYIVDDIAFGHIEHDGWRTGWQWNMDGTPATRNDAHYIISEWEEPKPPVIVDMWFNIDEDGCVESFFDKFSANSWHNKDFLETIHIRYDSSQPKGNRIKEIED